MIFHILPLEIHTITYWITRWNPYYSILNIAICSPLKSILHHIEKNYLLSVEIHTASYWKKLSALRWNPYCTILNSYRFPGPLTFQILSSYVYRSLSILVNIIVLVAGTGTGAFVIVLDVLNIVFLRIRVSTVAVRPFTSIVALLRVTNSIVLILIIFVSFSTSICLILQISAFACIRTFVLEIGLEKFFDSPTMWEPLEITVSLTCLEYNLRKKRRWV